MNMTEADSGGAGIAITCERRVSANIAEKRLTITHECCNAEHVRKPGT